MGRVKPILFNTEMVRAILDGRKTITRRVVKPQPIDEPILDDNEDEGGISIFCHVKGEDVLQDIFPPYQPEDTMYVRETWTKLYYVDSDGYTHYDQPMYFYAVDGAPDIDLRDADRSEVDNQPIHWQPSIHMPKEAARIWLRVTDVKVEHLRDITDEQAIKEGFSGVRCSCGGISFCSDCMGTGWQEPPTIGFMYTWDSTIMKSDLGRYGWEANPWVWVIAFERCEKPESEGD